MTEQAQYYVAVVGAGPAGLFAARELTQQGVGVVLFNRDLKPGGLAEYGIYPDKHKMKEGWKICITSGMC
jgi:ferredoxin--NADP+ reductase